jgi:hypothetical protein
MTTSATRQAVGRIAGLTAWLLFGPALEACPVCFQIEDGPAAAGVRGAVVVLLGVTVSVLAVTALFVVRVARRSADFGDEGAE